jgi:hypothetical protein
MCDTTIYKLRGAIRSRLVDIMWGYYNIHIIVTWDDTTRCTMQLDTTSIILQNVLCHNI